MKTRIEPFLIIIISVHPVINRFKLSASIKVIDSKGIGFLILKAAPDDQVICPQGLHEADDTGCPELFDQDVSLRLLLKTIMRRVRSRIESCSPICR